MIRGHAAFMAWLKDLEMGHKTFGRCNRDRMDGLFPCRYCDKLREGKRIFERTMNAHKSVQGRLRKEVEGLREVYNKL